MITYGKFDKHAVCKCGWKGQCHFGKLIHLMYDGQHIEVCPLCGASKETMKMETLRPKYIKKAWWRPRQFVCYETQKV